MRDQSHHSAYMERAVAEVCLSCRRPACTSGFYGCAEYKAALRKERERIRSERMAERINRDMLVEHKGEMKTVAEWCEATGIDMQLVSTRVNQGWDVERAVTTPRKDNHRARRPAAETADATGEKKAARLPACPICGGAVKNKMHFEGDVLAVAMSCDACGLRLERTVAIGKVDLYVLETWLRETRLAWSGKKEG